RWRRRFRAPAEAAGGRGGLSARRWKGLPGRRGSVEKLGRDLAAVGGELAHRGLVEPDVHLGAAVEIARIAELARQLLAVVEARVDADQFHQVDDRGAP